MSHGFYHIFEIIQITLEILHSKMISKRRMQFGNESVQECVRIYNDDIRFSGTFATFYSLQSTHMVYLVCILSDNLGLPPNKAQIQTNVLTKISF